MTTNEKDFLHYLKTMEFSPELVGEYDVPKIPAVRFKNLKKTASHRVQLLYRSQEYG